MMIFQGNVLCPRSKLGTLHDFDAAVIVLPDLTKKLGVHSCRGKTS